MAKQGAKGVVPRLRFPEFLGGEGWCATSLGRLTDLITKGTTPTSIGFQFVDQGINFIKIESIRDGAIDLSKMSAISDECHDALKRSQLKDGDLLFSIAGALGVTAVVDESILPANTNQALAIIRLKNRRSLGFIEKYLTTRAIESEIEKIRAGAAQSNISLAQVGDFSIALPSLPEQQKIADCLTSLDEVIAAQGRKVEALKTHKRGLMQQLFPHEGETRPRLRFHEFRDAPEWARSKVSDIVDVLQGYGFPERLQGSREGEFPFYKVSDISACVDAGGILLDQANNHIDGDVLEELRAKLMPAGSTVFAKIGEAIRSNKRAITSRPCLVDNNAAGVKAITGLAHDRFVYYLWCQVPLIEYAGGVVPAVNKSAIEQIPVCYPEFQEQQRIADFLSSFDTRLTAESRQLAALKSHKRGLMQQLFPSPEES